MHFAECQRAVEQGESGSSAALQYSCAVTTGHCGGPFAADAWTLPGLDSHSSSGRIRNSRPPIPTCSIATTGPASTTIAMVPIVASCFKPASAVLADALLDTQDPVQAKGGQTVSGSGDSTTDRLHQVSSREASQSRNPQPTGDESGLDDGQEDSLAEDGGLRRSTRQGRRSCVAVRQGQEQKKVGRPIVYRGDPDAPDLTEQERRRIKRRIANRESARRVRNKRQELLGDLVGKMEAMQAQNEKLRQHAFELDAQKAAVFAEIVELESKLKAACTEHSILQSEISAMRKNLQMRMSALDEALDRRMVETDASARAQEKQPSAGKQEDPRCSAFASVPFSGSQFTTECKPNLDTKMAVDLFPALDFDGLRAAQPGAQESSRPSLDAKMAMELFPSLNLDESHSNWPRAESMDLLGGICMFQSEEPAHFVGQTC